MLKKTHQPIFGMTLQEKRDTILAEIAQWNDEFLRQASYKIDKRYAPSPTDHIELVSDVIYSVIKKLDSRRDVNRFYIMVQEKRLHLYILKGIDSNCRYLNAPFLRHKLIQRNRIQICETLNIPDEDPDNETLEKSDYVKTFLSGKKAKETFGEDWKVYTTILKDYTENPNFTYRDLSKKYNISLGSIAWMMTKLKEKLKGAIENEEKRANIS